MALNVRQQDDSQQTLTCVNPHNSGDLCYESGFYGVAKLTNVAGGSNTLYIRGNFYLAVPASQPAGTLLHSASKPSGAIALSTSGAVTVGMMTTATDTTGNAVVTLTPYLSMGN